MLRLRCFTIAVAAVVIVHLPPVGDARAAVRAGVTALAEVAARGRLPSSPFATSRSLRVAPAPARAQAESLGPPPLRWPDGDVVDVPQRFERLAQSFDLTRSLAPPAAQ